MAETKYGKHFITEPIEFITEPIEFGPMLHICGDNDCYGTLFPGFPVEVQLMCISWPGKMIPEPHAHDVDEIFFVFGSNPKNYFEFSAEIEIMMGEEQERHIVDKTTIIYIPAGILHCPINILKVDKPFQWMHVLFQGKYQISETDDIPNHLSHAARHSYKPDEVVKLRQGITEGVKSPFQRKPPA